MKKSEFLIYMVLYQWYEILSNLCCYLTLIVDMFDSTWIELLIIFIHKA